MLEKLTELTAAVLVGGLGTRLRPVLPDQQKVLAPVGGRPFLFRVLDQLAECGLSQVVLCTGYRAADVVAQIGTRHRSMKILYSSEPAPLGTAGALRHALPLLGSDPVLALNGDSFCPVDLQAFWATHRQHGANASLVVSAVTDTGDGGRVTFDVEGRITSFHEKAPGEGWVSAGIYLLRQTVLASIPPAQNVSIERDVFPAWVNRGLFAFCTREKLLDIGTPATYAKVQQVLS